MPGSERGSLDEVLEKRVALATAATAGGLSLEQSVKYTVVVRLTLDRVNWLEVKLIAKLR